MLYYRHSLAFHNFNILQQIGKLMPSKYLEAQLPSSILIHSYTLSGLLSRISAGGSKERRYMRNNSTWLLRTSLTELVFGGKGNPTPFRERIYTIHVVIIIFELMPGLILDSLLPLKLPENPSRTRRPLKGGAHLIGWPMMM